MKYKIEFKTFNLKHKHLFRISRGARTETPVVLLKLSFGDFNGYGEASMPPMYGETHQTAINFLNKLDLDQFNDPFDMDSILTYVDQIDTGNSAVKASVDMAIHDIASKIKGIPLYTYLGLAGVDRVYTSKTIGIDKPDIIQKRVSEAAEFKILKIKLGTRSDKAIIDAIRKVSDKPLYVDANQGWKNKYTALDRIKWLHDQNVVLIEQPMPVDSKKESNWLKARSPLPIIGDEGIQRLHDVETAEQFYDGINIKLVKSTGLNEGLKMIRLAKTKELKVMIGCMAETSCSISAAFNLVSEADYVDLDGNLGISNDPFTGIKRVGGELINHNLPGIGLINAEESWNRI